jgi:hypothetical protein
MLMLPLRRLEGRTPRSTHCRMRRSPKKQNQLPHTSLRSSPALTSSALLIPCRSALTPGVLPPPGAPTPADLAALSPTRRDPWSTSGVAGEWVALLYSSACPFSPRRPWRSLPPISHRRRRAKPDIGGAGGGGVRAPSLAAVSRPRWLESTSPGLPLPYVANVCFSCFKCMLQLFLMDVTKLDRGCCIYCKCFRSMLQAFVQNVSYVSGCMLQSFFICMLHMFLHICCNTMF